MEWFFTIIATYLSSIKKKPQEIPLLSTGSNTSVAILHMACGHVPKQSKKKHCTCYNNITGT